MKKWTKHEALGYLDKQIEVIHTLKLGRRGSSEHVRWLTNTLVFLEEYSVLIPIIIVILRILRGNFMGNAYIEVGILTGQWKHTIRKPM